jgi:hypothetical protein
VPFEGKKGSLFDFLEDLDYDDCLAKGQALTLALTLALALALALALSLSLSLSLSLALALEP